MDTEVGKSHTRAKCPTIIISRLEIGDSKRDSPEFDDFSSDTSKEL
jgi:hypothetical protein